MRIFISWSGERSKFVAEALYSWFSTVVQSVDPWMSSKDIDKGSISMDELNGQLKGVEFGIVCLTPENLDSTWIHFEAGAITRAVLNEKGSRLWTYLLGLNNTDVKGPLWQFQHTIANEEDTKKLLYVISKVSPKPLTDNALEDLFKKFWPDLEEKLRIISAMPTAKPASRPQESMIEETLELVRGLVRENADAKRLARRKESCRP